MAKILVVGSANMDVVTPVRRLPVPGETLLIDDIRLVPGGKGANAAVAAVRLGAEVRFVGCVGDDPFGETIRRGLTDEGIGCDHLTTGDRGSGTAVILLNQTNGQNSILVGPGTNYQVTLPDNDDLFKWADSMMLQLETPVELNIQAARRASAHGTRVILDPAPAVDNLPDELLSLVDIVSPNESELSTMTGRGIDSIDDAIDAARGLLKRGVKELVVKLGEKGALWVTPKSHTHVPAVAVDVADTTAAGDAFTAALCVALANGDPMEQAMAEGCLAGALTCTRIGAQTSLPTQSQLQLYRNEIDS